MTTQPVAKGDFLEHTIGFPLLLTVGQKSPGSYDGVSIKYETLIKFKTVVKMVPLLHISKSYYLLRHTKYSIVSNTICVI